MKTRPGFTLRFSEPPACWVFATRPDFVRRRRCLSLAAAAFLPASGQCYAHGHRIRISPEPVLGTAFHSPVTALSPPLRGQRSRPAPSPPRRRTSRIRSVSGSFAPLRFRGDAGRSLRRTPVFHVHFPRSDDLDGLHSPSGHCSPADQSVQPFRPPEAHLAERPITLPDSLRPARQIVP